MTPLFAYFGPETVLPATSIIATILGVALMLGKSSVRWCFGLAKSVVDAGLGRKADETPAVPAPHFPHAARTRVVEDAQAR
ncbi:hypothetical protein [Paludisphaera mucosa]|uniref:Uncharacterized protein n=1 Tax=Paludisphaera mucosa TaxID=3030827 RepID=A0ABT6FB90_9BACT|nr:hypothetical protein [Paludisphaera mucosa]MDG3004648.1 hypothetical protein [Paludisphaera mucosa]